MAMVRPFKGYRYASPGEDISTYAAPPYDIVDERQRAELAAANPFNAVQLELAEGPLDPDAPDSRYATAAARWKSWIDDGILLRDSQPDYYLVEQRFMARGTMHTRNAVIAEAQLHPFSEGIILPHEKTLPKALDDRLFLENATNANFSPVFGLFDGKDGYGDFLAECKEKDPSAVAVDADGCESRMWLVTDQLLMQHFTDLAADSKIFIADGHHRYTVALKLRDVAREERYGVPPEDAPMVQGFDANNGSEFVMMALVDINDDGLVVLPTHRGVHASMGLPADGLLAWLEHSFDLGPAYGGALEKCPRPAFLVKTQGQEPVLASLKDDIDLDDLIPEPHSDQWKQLDVSVLQQAVMQPLFGISPSKASSAGDIVFSKDADELCAQVDEGILDAAFLLRPVSIQQLCSVSLSGETMPQKSTYFYPKLPSGFVFRAK